MTPSLQLAKELREIARLWDEDRKGGYWGSGICYEVSRRATNEEYGAVTRTAGLLVAEMTGRDPGKYLYPEGEQWDARANMCLLMAHWIEDLQEKSDE